MRNYVARCSNRLRLLSDAKRYWIGAGLSVLIVIVLLGGAVVSGSSTLYAGSFHALADAFAAYGWALITDYRVARQPSAEARMRRQGSILNGIFCLVAGIGVIADAIGHAHRNVNGPTFFSAELANVILNCLQFWVIGHGCGHSTNTELNTHNKGDIYEGLVGMLTSVIVAITGWKVVDRIAGACLAAWYMRQGAQMLRKPGPVSVPAPVPHHHHHHRRPRRSN